MNLHTKLKQLTSKQDEITHLNESTSGLKYGTVEYRDAAIAMRKLQDERRAIFDAIVHGWEEMVQAQEENKRLREACEKAYDALDRAGGWIHDETRAGWAMKAIDAALKDADHATD